MPLRTCEVLARRARGVPSPKRCARSRAGAPPSAEPRLATTRLYLEEFEPEEVALARLFWDFS